VWEEYSQKSGEKGIKSIVAKFIKEKYKEPEYY
jgi:hypothetical protein